MKNFTLSLLLVLFVLSVHAQITHPADGPVYDKNEIAKIEVFIDADSLAVILDPDNAESDHEFPADIFFTNNGKTDTIPEIGFRLRGNTSRVSDKKSFKIAFNSFTSGRRYEGLKKFNLNGEHNDPSICRSRICWELGAANGIPVSRVAHAELYVNNEYKGLYINLEHINDDWLSLRFGNNSGNLYKCLYPANLRFISNNPDDYKMTSYGGDRVYALKTNEEIDDYSGLAHFIDVLNNTPMDQLACALDEVFNTEAYLQALAFEVLMGHWDNYSYNQNNFYLYKNPATGKIEYIPYDMDNTMGIDWFGIDWANHDINNWNNPYEDLPMAKRLLSVPELKEIYMFYLRELQQQIIASAFLNGIDAMHEQIKEAAYADIYKSMDYGFTNEDFDASFTTTQSDMHVKTGIIPYMENRAASALTQLGTFNVAPIVRYPQADVTSAPGNLIFKAYVADEGMPEVSCSYSVNGGSYESITLFDDGQHHDGQANDGCYANVLENVHAGSISYQMTATDAQNQSRTRPCTPQTVIIKEVGNLVINEFMADNENTIADNNGDYSDWIELYNNSEDEIFLGDYYLTDNVQEPFKWQLPEDYLEAGGFALVWASGDVGSGAYHSNFKLSKGGEEIGLFTDEGGEADTADFIVFGAQSPDISYGRATDAAPAWVFFDTPTPGASNGTAGIENTDFAQLSVFPNPYKQQFTIKNEGTEALQAQLYDVQGRLLLQTEVRPGSSYQADDSFGSGLRILQLSTGNETKRIKMVAY